MQDRHPQSIASDARTIKGVAIWNWLNCYCGISPLRYITPVTWLVEYTDEFEGWWNELAEDEQESIAVVVTLLESLGPNLPFPYSSDIRGSRHGAMRELRIQHKGRPYRVVYAFDPRRAALLIIGGDKTGDDRWYESNVPRADDIYDAHIEALKAEGLI
jgi:hypothetical protein